MEVCSRILYSETSPTYARAHFPCSLPIMARCLDKVEKAKIRVEHIIREDYLVEAMELVEMFCDLLLARFDLFQSMRLIDPGLEESIASIIWVVPRMKSDVPELKVIYNELIKKFKKQYVDQCVANRLANVNERLIQRMSVEAPPRILVERYLVEIATSHHVAYAPDPKVMAKDQEWNLGQKFLIDLEKTSSDPPSSSSYDHYGSQLSLDEPAQTTTTSTTDSNALFDNIYPSASAPSLEFHEDSRPPVAKNIPAVHANNIVNEKRELNNGGDKVQPKYDQLNRPIGFNVDSKSQQNVPTKLDDFGLPSVPENNPSNVFPSTKDLDFDELSRRFEELKKRH